MATPEPNTRVTDSDNMIMDAMQAMVSIHQKEIPIVHEDVFVKNILPLLECPWAPGALDEYRKYVHELSNPLRVASVNTKEAVVLFTVPALYPRPSVAISSGENVASISNVMDYYNKEHNRNPRGGFAKEAAQFLERCIYNEPLEKQLLQVLIQILAAYGRVLKNTDGTPLYELPNASSSKSGGVQVDTPENDECVYGDEYED
ncbi:hypothetical protein fnug_79 [Pseudomonas phage fnug]|uniref:Uncharacterized protein n=2 Tax=root TaxID=1 RepID=A0A6H2A8Y2_9CAUD|nr:hypothetical protein fnug_79 [Pseudomonas phage fnug]QYV99242.1 hypothetical protein [Pseudomonas phage U1B]UXD83610.1 hypothetical protein NP274_00203 [Pseudomonas phage Koomba boorn-mokiny kep-wari Wadjak 2]BDR25169.1 hypothetical protein RVBP14_3350 [Pseudomonas phage sp. Brmt]BDR26617.1 hypothetical protein RVBP18_2720 [Pseudomonas phage sp. LC]BDR26847.1 hypothetical protein RVBP20_0880 [Pseudomonas phage sp. NK1]